MTDPLTPRLREDPADLVGEIASLRAALEAAEAHANRLAGRVAELEKWLEEEEERWHQTEHERCDALNQEQRVSARLHQATEALRFYADDDRYCYDETCCPTRNNPGGVLEDQGEIAGSALAALAGEDAHETTHESKDA